MASTTCPPHEGCNALTTFDDLDDMASLYLDATTTELLISGAVEIDDAPPGFDRIAGMINKAQGAATAGELAARAAIVTTFAAKVRSRPVRARTKRTFAFPKFSAKVLALTAPVVLLGGGVAAGTDSLPPSAQAVVSRALSSLGISVPKPDIDNRGIAGSPVSSTGGAAARGTGPDSGPRGRATVGLCRAWRAGGLTHPSTAYRNLATAAGGAGHLPAYCAGVPPPSAPLGATGHAGTPSSGQLDGRKGVTRSSTTRGNKTVVRAAGPRSRAIAVRHSGAVTRGRAAASTSTPTTTTWRHGPKPPGTSRPPVASRGRLPVSGGLQVPGGTHKATASDRSRHQRPSTKAGQGKPPVSKLSTQGESGTTSPVWASPVSSSMRPGRGPSQHHGQNGRPGRPRGCTDSSRPGRLIQSRQRCHPVTPKGSTSNPPAGSRRHGRRAGSSVGSTPRSVKHRAIM